MLRKISFGIQWKPSESAEPIPLKDLTLERGNWQISPLYVQVAAAKEWGVLPYDFFARPYSERMLMVGFDLVEKKMAAYEQAYAERQAKLTKDNVK